MNDRWQYFVSVLGVAIVTAQGYTVFPPSKSLRERDARNLCKNHNQMLDMRKG